MKFKDYQDYTNKRTVLLDDAKKLLDSGDIEGFNAKTKEIENMDKAYEEFANSQANFNALQNSALPQIQLSNIADPSAFNPQNTEENKIKNESETYKNAFANYMMGKGLSDEEKTVFENVNSGFKNSAQTVATHTVLIPESVKQGIWQEIGESHPIFGDAAPTFVKGDSTIIKETKSGDDAEWYDEDTNTKDDEVAFGELNLTGCELAKAIPVSWKLKKMSIDAFLTYITSKIAEKMGNALSKAMVSGKGKPGVSDTFKAQPKGIKTALEAEKDKPQVKTYVSADGIVYKDLTALFALIKSGYKKVIYANSTTIWNQLANIVDGMGRPLFIPDVTNGGVAHILGAIVKEEDAVSDGAVLVGDVSKGYAININENMTMYQEDHIKARTTDYMGYAIVDGDVLTTKAFALLEAAGE